MSILTPAAESQTTQLNARRCTGRCRVDLQHDDADEVVTTLFHAATIRKLDIVDALVTIIAVVDLSVAGYCTRTPEYVQDTSLVALRALSLLRSIRLLVNWKTMQGLFRTIVDSAQELLSFFVLMLIFVYVWLLLWVFFFFFCFFFFRCWFSALH